MLNTPSITSLIEAASGRTSSLPASILEKSRTSSMMRSREFPDSRMISSVVRCSASSLVRARSSTMPNTPFIGVLISWLMVARNVLFQRCIQSQNLALLFFLFGDILANSQQVERPALFVKDREFLRVQEALA